MSIISDMNLIVFKENIYQEDFDKIYTKLKLENHLGYYLLNVPRTLFYKELTWWPKDGKGYTNDLSDARIFSVDEINKKLDDRLL